jgi:hypothetical protein
MPFDAPRSPFPFDNEDDRRAWIEATTKALLADPGFKAVIETAFSAIAHGRAHDQ